MVNRVSVGGLVLPRRVATSAQVCALHPFALQAGTGGAGVLLGRDRLAGGEGFLFDLFTAYDAGLIQGPNMVISGAGTYGKSALAKVYAYRSSILATGGRARFTAVIDPKGEWLPLADALGWTSLRLRPGGGVRINPFDPGPRPVGGDTDTAAGDLLAQRVAVATTLLAVALGRTELSAPEQRLVAAAVAHLTTTYAGRRAGSPTLVDLRDLLARPPAALADTLDTTLDELLGRRRELLDACAMLVEQDLRGICDGPSTIALDWAELPGLVLDLSALLTHRRALRLVLTATAGWLAAVMYHQPHRHKITIIDEGWAALEDLAIVRYLQDQWRLGRQWGSANILLTHALDDLSSQADEGKAQNKIAEGLLNTTSVRVFLHQNPERVGRLLSEMGLTTAEAGLLDRLTPFQALWKLGAHTALVDHTVADWEWPLCDTDTAMRGAAGGRVA